jgi:hypothetical protein
VPSVAPTRFARCWPSAECRCNLSRWNICTSVGLGVGLLCAMRALRPAVGCAPQNAGAPLPHLLCTRSLAHARFFLLLVQRLLLLGRDVALAGWPSAEGELETWVRPWMPGSATPSSGMKPPRPPPTSRTWPRPVRQRRTGCQLQSSSARCIRRHVGYDKYVEYDEYVESANVRYTQMFATGREGGGERMRRWATAANFTALWRRARRTFSLCISAFHRHV